MDDDHPGEPDVARLFAPVAVEESAGGQASLMGTCTGSLVPAAEAASTPEALALLRVLAAVGSPPLRAAAGQAAARLSAHGVADPPWARTVGAPRVGDCWHYADVGGRQESLTMTFAYGGLRADTEREAGLDPLVVFEVIDAAGARRRLGRAIGAGECPEQPDQVDDVVAHRALLRARLDLLTALA